MLVGCTAPTNNVDLPKIADTVKINIPTIEIVKEEPKIKPIPAYTKYKVSDIVCVWGKWTGIVAGIEWSDADPNILIYRVAFPVYTDEEKPEDVYFYDTELELGKC